MPDTIYRYSLDEGEPKISQGDIFSNLPIFSYDFLIPSAPNMISNFKNENLIIYENVIQKGCKVQVEGFISPEWGILASQDCDIRPGWDLIFLPLRKTKSMKLKDDIVESVKTDIKDSTRTLYISKLIDHTVEEGPFEIMFQNPFYVPYDIIMNNYGSCWKARLIDSAKKVFLGKLSHFYTRTPLEEFIFLENEEITDYIIKNWRRFWKKEGKKTAKFKEKLENILEVIDLLILVKRKDDIKKIFYYDIEFIDRLMKILEALKIEKIASELLKLSARIKNFYEKQQEVANKMFVNLVNTLHTKSFFTKCRELFENESLKEIRKGNYIDGILPEYIKNDDAVEYVTNLFRVKDDINNIPEFIQDYVKVDEHLKKINRKY